MAVEMNNPSVAELVAAFAQLEALNPKMKLGQWGISISAPPYKFSGLNEKEAKRIREFGAALNSDTYCRKTEEALDTSTKFKITYDANGKCVIKSLRADIGKISWEKLCDYDFGKVRETVDIEFANEVFRSQTVREVGTDSRLSVLYEGSYIGACDGSEDYHPMYWSDR